MKNIVKRFSLTFLLFVAASLLPNPGVRAQETSEVSKFISNEEFAQSLNTRNPTMRAIFLSAPILAGGLTKKGAIRKEYLSNSNGFSSLLYELPVGISESLFSVVAQRVTYRVNNARSGESCHGGRACCESAPDFTCAAVVPSMLAFRRWFVVRDLIAIELQDAAVDTISNVDNQRFANDSVYVALRSNQLSRQPPLVSKITPNRLQAVLAVIIAGRRTLLPAQPDTSLMKSAVKCSHGNAVLQTAPTQINWVRWAGADKVSFYATNIPLPELMLAIEGDSLWLDLRDSRSAQAPVAASSDLALLRASSSCFGSDVRQPLVLQTILSDPDAGRLAYLLALAAGWLKAYEHQAK